MNPNQSWMVSPPASSRFAGVSGSTTPLQQSTPHRINSSLCVLNSFLLSSRGNYNTPLSRKRTSPEWEDGMNMMYPVSTATMNPSARTPHFSKCRRKSGMVDDPNVIRLSNDFRLLE